MKSALPESVSHQLEGIKLASTAAFLICKSSRCQPAMLSLPEALTNNNRLGGGREGASQSADGRCDGIALPVESRVAAAKLSHDSQPFAHCCSQYCAVVVAQFLDKSYRIHYIYGKDKARSTTVKVILQKSCKSRCIRTAAAPHRRAFLSPSGIPAGWLAVTVVTVAWTQVPWCCGCSFRHDPDAPESRECGRIWTAITIQ